MPDTVEWHNLPDGVVYANGTLWKADGTAFTLKEISDAAKGAP